jgi:hypothetical protein
MTGELIPTAYTYNQGRIAINNAFSGISPLSAVAVAVTTTGNTYGAQAGDALVVQTGTDNVYLPQMNGESRIIIVKNYGIGSIDVLPLIGGAIDGSSGVTLSPLQCVTIHGDGGTNWYITSKFV